MSRIIIQDEYLLLDDGDFFLLDDGGFLIIGEEQIVKRGGSRGGLEWPWERRKKEIERETEEFLLFIDE